MDIIGIIIILVICVVMLIGLAVFQLKMAGIKVKDFWTFVEANQMLDKLYAFQKKFQDKHMSEQEQLIYMMEAEKVFKAFDLIPKIVWEEEYNKYSEVLDTYKNIKIMRWAKE